MPKIFEPKAEMININNNISAIMSNSANFFALKQPLWDDCFEEPVVPKKNSAKLHAVTERHFCLFDDCVDEGLL
ncbi:MAG: hypothetical protein K0S08_2234 [Gammaproteobacteria bacterium]|nr:hypothetical protein [Gammaproteobacteria bacterium]